MQRTFSPFLVFGFIYAVPFIIGVLCAEWTDREFHIHLGWAAISIAYCFIFRFKPLIVLLSLFFILTSCFDIQYAMVFKALFTTSSVEAMTQTNPQEAFEFIASYFDPLAAVVTILYVLICIYLLMHLRCHGLPKKVPYQALAVFSFVVLCGFLYEGLWVKQRYTKLLPGIAGALPSYYRNNKSLHDEIQERAAFVQAYSERFYNTDSSQQTYVFVIGEATTRRHMGLYGYGRDTTPKLSQRDDLVVCQDVISNFVQTLPSLRYSLTQAVPGEEPAYHQALSIVDVANLAGFKTWWISNQQPLRGTYSAIAEQADVTTFISNRYYGREVGRYDGLLLPEYKDALQDEAPKKVIFLHMMGSHLKYIKRYPPEFHQFSAPPYFAYTQDLSESEKFYINTYDNSIAYTDTVMNSVIEQLRTHAIDRVAALSFISDHGEEVFDTIEFKGHGHGPETLTQPSFDIPFVVWLSPTYRAQYTTKVEQLGLNRGKPYMLNDYFYFALDLMNVSAPSMATDMQRKSLFSADVSTGKRWVYGQDYDRLFEKNMLIPPAELTEANQAIDDRSVSFSATDTP